MWALLSLETISAIDYNCQDWTSPPTHISPFHDRSTALLITLVLRSHTKLFNFMQKSMGNGCYTSIYSEITTRISYIFMKKFIIGPLILAPQNINPPEIR